MSSDPASTSAEDKSKNRVLVAMSGGVDSSVAAALLKTQGYEVIGVYFRLWDDETNPYPATDGGSCGKGMDPQHAQAVCKQLEISLHIMDLRAQYQNDVVNPMVNDILMGKKCSTCTLCNHKIKFGTLFKKADELKCNWVATGHYARKVFEVEHDEYHIYKASDLAIDQSFYFAGLTQTHLSRLLTPMGDLLRSYVTKMATTFYLPAIDRAQNTKYCYVEDFATTETMMDKRVADHYRFSGPYNNPEGSILGRHKGLYIHRFGLNEGIDPSSIKDSSLCTVGFDLGANAVILGKDIQVPRKQFVIGRCNWIGKIDLSKGFQGDVKLSAFEKPLPCIASLITNNSVVVNFEKPQYNVIPGQFVTFYIEDQLMGGGVIDVIESPPDVPKTKI